LEVSNALAARRRKQEVFMQPLFGSHYRLAARRRKQEVFMHLNSNFIIDSPRGAVSMIFHATLFGSQQRLAARRRQQEVFMQPYLEVNNASHTPLILKRPVPTGRSMDSPFFTSISG
jgi:hypothetical protein